MSSARTPEASEFFEKLTRVVGADHVFSDEQQRRRYARTTLPDGTEPLGAVLPKATDELQEILRLATAARVAVYPVSTKKNWGYGDACAPRSGCLIVDLSRMNRIVEVNVPLAYAVVEPGVTQGQLAEHLARKNLPLLMDCTGAGPNAGVIGNILERGFGHSPYGDRFAHSCAYEAVLADGSHIAPGLGGDAAALSRHVYKWGVGPVLDGLFTQSNFAIVTRMTVWLIPKPQSASYYFIGLSDARGMAELAERLRPLYLSGTLRNVLHCANDHRLLASNTQYPWAEADGTASLELGAPRVFQRLVREFNVLAWSCAGVLLGSREEVAAQKKQLRRALKGMPGLDKLFVLGERAFAWSQKLAPFLPARRPFQGLSKDLAKVRWMIELLRGQPSNQFLMGAHWRARKTPDGGMDPLESGSGLIWLGPVLPMTREAVHQVNAIGLTMFQKFGFEYQVTFSFLNERALCAIMSISFDQASPSEKERARQCEAALFDRLMEKGFVPYRGSPRIQRALTQRAPDYWRRIQQLQHAWDPAGILAPGRYCLE